MSSPSALARYQGCLLGLACGDAVGTTVEFMARGSFPPVTDMTGGGPFSLRAGEWTDDTSMALCLAHSLVYRNGFHAVDQMNRYCNWWHYGYMSSTGECFDIGATVAAALKRYLDTQDPFAGATDPNSAGNGALMRLAPIAMFYAQRDADLFTFASDSTRTTHGAREAIECSRLFALQLQAALRGAPKAALLVQDYPEPLSEKLLPLAQGAYRGKPEAAIRGSGYCVASLEAALWCFDQTDTFEAAILKAANLGDDADTTAAICGQIAGAHYGIAAIPAHWVSQLAMRDEIMALADALFTHAQLPNQ
ncbi:ADP-ribosylglycohydrolase family protein [Massilia sp. CF038]|uniref:ADP-ribosylglycohydrolase family protein n=1 Tax=Massilia sp. CF038 TaxID=1881045 RepID=UPI0009241E98|nr:ADP-ribosylglycohydrolase family protein [Massilia sp. CF038]SHG46780.1 ADP-ribosyl-[dinitrogen reductase] hydrolase [Massilia sp. CF038]